MKEPSSANPATKIKDKRDAKINTDMSNAEGQGSEKGCKGKWRQQTKKNAKIDRTWLLLLRMRLISKINYDMRLTKGN